MPVQKTTPQRPNVLVLMLDSVRPANMSCYGYRHQTTPYLDELAQRSTVYEQAVSMGGWTMPVHASLFTGVYPITHGMTLRESRLPEDLPTLAHQLQAVGYQTACFSSNPFISDLTGLSTGFETVEDLWRTGRPGGLRQPRSSRLLARLDRFRPWSRPAIGMVRWLQRLRWAAQSRRFTRDNGAQSAGRATQAWLRETWRRERPFFIFINFMECHTPYRPPTPYNRRFLPPGLGPAEAAVIATRLASNDRPEHASPRELAALEAMYNGELAYLDEQIGRFVTQLSGNGFLDNTMLIVTSDHGDSLGEHGNFGHRVSLYEELVRVPLIVHYPERFSQGTRLSQQVQLIDLHQTLLELAGAEIHPAASQACWSLPKDGGAPERPFTIAENTGFGNVVARMIRTRRHKYIRKSNGHRELYELLSDPEELNNLAETERGVLLDLDAKLDAWENSQACAETPTGQAEYDQLVLERLRDLGYVN